MDYWEDDDITSNGKRIAKLPHSNESWLYSEHAESMQSVDKLFTAYNRKKGPKNDKR